MTYYTQTDLTNVQAAIIALATGQRVVSVTISGRTIQYGQAELNDLKALRGEIQRELQSAAGKQHFVLTKTSKGL